jgi:NADH:ubiquinone oxidoreductase subunit E
MNAVETSKLPADVVAFIEECRARPHAESYLIPVLQRLQTSVGYLDKDQMDEVAWRMRIPYAKVSGVATFYHFFQFKPKGRHTVTVCMGTACYVRGAAKVLERFKEILQIQEGQTTKDGRFSIANARCIGACAMAPVVVVGEKVYGNVKPGDVEKILAAHT